MPLSMGCRGLNQRTEYLIPTRIKNTLPDSEAIRQCVFYPKLVTIQATGAKQSLILRVSSAFSKPEGTERLEWPEPGQW